MTTNELIHSDLGVSETGVGIVYVLANPAMQSCMKIGVTKDLAERMRSLDQPSSVPLPFECVYAVKVANARAWERVLHEVFSESRIKPQEGVFPQRRHGESGPDSTNREARRRDVHRACGGATGRNARRDETAGQSPGKF